MLFASLQTKFSSVAPLLAPFASLSEHFRQPTKWCPVFAPILSRLRNKLHLRYAVNAAGYRTEPPSENVLWEHG